MLEFFKEHWIELLSLAICGLTLFYTIRSYCYVRKSDKKRILSEIARKQAILDSYENDRFLTMGVDHTVADKIRLEKQTLKIEIEELRKEL